MRRQTLLNIRRPTLLRIRKPTFRKMRRQTLLNVMGTTSPKAEGNNFLIYEETNYI
jgi:hypothetical protein